MILILLPNKGGRLPLESGTEKWGKALLFFSINSSIIFYFYHVHVLL